MSSAIKEISDINYDLQDLGCWKIEAGKLKLESFKLESFERCGR